MKKILKKRLSTSPNSIHAYGCVPTGCVEVGCSTTQCTIGFNGVTGPYVGTLVTTVVAAK